jgi:hypothetical protein
MAINVAAPIALTAALLDEVDRDSLRSTSPASALKRFGERSPRDSAA